MDKREPETDRHVLFAGHVLFAVLLVIGVVRAALDMAQPVIPILAGVAVAAWYGAGAVWVTRRRDRVARMWLVVLILLWGGLVGLSGEFVWLAFLLALLVWHLFPVRWAIPTEVLIAVVATLGFAAHQGRWVVGAIIGPTIGIACAAVMTEIYQRLRAQSEERRNLLDELLRTQRELAVRERETGRLIERERLAREIHDTVGQSLAGVIMLLRAATADRGDDHSDATGTLAAQLNTALHTATSALAETRRMVLGLDPVGGGRDDLPQALATLAGETSELGLPTRFVELGKRGDLPTPTQVALLRAAQEALSNARKHARASQATVTLTHGADAIGLDISDDGRGFEPDATGGVRADGSGYGLTSMRSRTTELGGDFGIESGNGSGTTIRMRVPVSTTAEQEGTTIDRAATRR